MHFTSLDPKEKAAHQQQLQKTPSAHDQLNNLSKAVHQENMSQILIYFNQ